MRVCHPDLTARWPGEELAQGNKVCVCLVSQPLPTGDKLVVKITEVGHWPTKRGEAKAKKNQKHAPRLAAIGCQNHDGTRDMRSLSGLMHSWYRHFLAQK